MPKVLVTGAAGYLGSTLVPRLLEVGYSVTAVDNFLYQQDSLAAVCYSPRFSLVRGDVRDGRVMRPLVEDADFIIPLAAIVGAPACDRDPLAATSINKDAILQMVPWLEPSQRVLLPITNSGYGTGAHCTEETPMRPLSLYGRDKVAVERELLDRHPNTISFRFATVFGMSPRMRLDLLVNDFTYRACTDGSIVLFESQFKRNYLHVRDAARAFLHGMERFDAMKGQAYNVGLSDANLSKRELCERIKCQVPSFVILESETGHDPDRRDYVVSNAKIESAGYRTSYSLDDGIRELVKGYAMIRNSRYANV